MESIQKLNKYETVGLLLIVIINQIILNMTSYIISRTNSASWINIIYISILFTFFIIFICKLFKPFDSFDILDISNYLGSKYLKSIIGILYIIFFIFFSSISLRHISESLRLIYFEETPIIYIMLFFMIPVSVISKLGIKTISRLNLIFMSIYLISLVVILFSTIKLFIPQRLFPILGYGINKTFVEGIINISSFTFISYLYFLLPFLKNTNEFKKIGIATTLVSSLYLLSSVIYLLVLFPFIPFSDEILSIYLIARLIKFGRFFQRIDALFIFIWILSILSFLSLTLFMICNIFKRISKIENFSVLCFPFSLIIFGSALSFKNISQVKNIENTLFCYIAIVLLFIITPIILILAYLKKKKLKRK